MRLAIVGDTRHSRDPAGRLCTLDPVVRQLQPWLEAFDEVLFCGTFQPGPPPPTHAPYPLPNVRLRPLRIAGGPGLRQKTTLLRRAAEWWPTLRRTLRECDVVHFRCPCAVALVGLLAARDLPIRRFAMYAGNWAGYPGESAFYGLQRRWLGSPRFGGTVAVYGEWPDQPSHVVTSFSPSYTRAEWEAEGPAVERKLARWREAARHSATSGRPPGSFAVALVGHLTPEKSPATLLRAIARLRVWNGVEVRAELLGEGPERPALEALARSLGISGSVRLRGRVSLEEVRAAYRAADAAVLASRTEGFPKALVEAMAGGAVPVASDVGINAQLLAGRARGLLFPFGDAEALAERLAFLAAYPQERAARAQAAREYSGTVTLDEFYALQRRILTERLGVPDRAGQRATAVRPAEALPA